jgi:hypothetical protein
MDLNATHLNLCSKPWLAVLINNSVVHWKHICSARFPFVFTGAWMEPKEGVIEAKTAEESTKLLLFTFNCTVKTHFSPGTWLHQLKLERLKSH